MGMNGWRRFAYPAGMGRTKKSIPHMYTNSRLCLISMLYEKFKNATQTLVLHFLLMCFFFHVQDKRVNSHSTSLEVNGKSPNKWCCCSLFKHSQGLLKEKSEMLELYVCVWDLMMFEVFCESECFFFFLKCFVKEWMLLCNKFLV